MTIAHLSGLWLAFENKTMKLRKKHSLLRLFQRAEVDLVLHGHHHDNCEYKLSGTRFMNAGGTVMGPDPSTFNVNLVRYEGQCMHTETRRIPSDAPPVLNHNVDQGELVYIAA